MGIECQVCHKVYVTITGTHLRKHDMVLKDYIEKYPSSPLVDEGTADRLRRQNPGKKKVWTKKDREEISAKLSGRKRTQETKRRISESKLGVPLSPQHRKNISTSLKGKLAGKKHPLYGKTSPHSRPSIYKDRKGREFALRSTWEVRVAAYLDKNDMDWDYEVVRYTLGEMTYLPDFTVYNTGGGFKLIEVKGWMSDKSRARIEKFRDLYPYISLEVWDGDKLKELGI